MKSDEILLRLGPRIKLLKRHAQEWTALLKHQQQVIRFAKEAKQRHLTHPDNKLTTIQQIVYKGVRLYQLNIRQRLEREEMKARQLQEEVELEQIFSSQK